MPARPPDSARTSAALFTIGCALVLCAELWRRCCGAVLTENEAVAALTAHTLGGACFIGNLQAGSWGYRVAAGLALAVAAALAWPVVLGLV